MADEIGRTKSGQLLRLYDDGKEYKLEIGGEIAESFPSRAAAVCKAKVLMIKSWLPKAAEDNINDMLKSYVDFEYNFTLEWCDRQAEEHIDCDCGCWGYPMELGFPGIWKKDKYRGCPQCGENIELGK